MADHVSFYKNFIIVTESLSEGTHEVLHTSILRYV